MSQSIVLACAAACNLSFFTDALERIARDRSATFSRFEQELQVVEPHNRSRLTLSEVSDHDAVALDYESNDELDDRFRREVLALRFYSLYFNDFEIAREVLLGIVADLGARGMVAMSRIL